MPTQDIFYSWQSDLPNSANRGFIEDCLSRAIKEVRGGEELKLDPCLERDTRGRQRLRLLAPSPEHERIAALEPHDGLPGARQHDQQLVDGRLLHRRPPRRL